MKFAITTEQQARVQKWLTETVYPAVIAKQKAEITDPSIFATDSWEMGYPWEGASGGGLTYEFTPTGIGVVERVRYGDHKLDITDYDLW